MSLQFQHHQPIKGRGRFAPSSPSSPTRIRSLFRKGVARAVYQWQWKKKRSICCLHATGPSRTRTIMDNISLDTEAGGAGGAYSYAALKKLDKIWQNLCSASPALQESKIVSSFSGSLCQLNLEQLAGTFDILVCGGTLGIFVATALSSKGLRVGIVERNMLKGGEQEWNISMKELLELVHVGILAEDDIKQAIAVEFNPNRCGFEGKGDIWVKDILNLGVL